MTVADATPDIEHIRQEDRAFLGHPKGLGFLGFTEACERFSYYSMQTLLTLYMVNYLLLAGHIEKVTGLAWLQKLALPRPRGAAALIGDFRRLHIARLPDADPRRDHRRQADGPEDCVDRRGAGDGPRPFPDGVRRCVPVRIAGADRRRRPVQGQYRDPGRRALRRTDLRRAMAFQIFYIFINVSVIAAPLISGTLGQKSAGITASAAPEW